MIKNTNDGSASAPYLRNDINYLNCDELPDFSIGPKGSDLEIHKAIKEAGYSGIQDGDLKICQEMGLASTVTGRVNAVGEIEDPAKKWKDLGYDCATLHIGWGMESDDEIARIVEDVLDTSENLDFPLYIETHRGTITQDMYRTVKLVERFPEIRINGDFSHWYTGQEMVYGGFENKLDFIQPVLDRVRFIHARIGNPGCIQVDIGDAANQIYVDHFKAMWTKCFVSFLKSAEPGSISQ